MDDDRPHRGPEAVRRRRRRRSTRSRTTRPRTIEDWPDDEAKYKTFGGPEGDSSYEEGATSKLGESEVRHHEDGSVTVKGEKVDNPDDYKGDPIPGGPTDPNAASISGERNLADEERKGLDDDETTDDED